MSKSTTSSKEKNIGKAIVDYVIYMFAATILFLLRCLPFEALVFIGRLGGGLVYYLDARHRKVAIKNLRLAFREEYTEEQVKGIARENFKRIGGVFTSSVKLHYLPESKIRKIMKIELEQDPQCPSPMLCQPANGLNATLFAIGHFGNFEIFAWVGRLAKWKKFSTTYRGLPNERLNELIQRGRAFSGCEFLERRFEGSVVKERLRDPECHFGLLADQRMANGGVTCLFFGRECLTSAAPAIFALRYDRPLRVGVCFQTGFASWTITFYPAIPLYKKDGTRRSAKSITQDINDQYEQAIRKDPANWFWVHNRWKAVELHQIRKRERDEV